MKYFSLIVALFFSSAVQAEFVNADILPKSKHTKAGLYLYAKDAYNKINAEAGQSVFIDVRTRAEIAFTGMPSNADANIPFKVLDQAYAWDAKRQNFAMTKNPEFVSRVASLVKQKGVTINHPLYVMCRSGGRSAKAADALTQAGFTQVISIVDGFEGDKVKSGTDKGLRILNGWKNSQLPWVEKLPKEKMYFENELAAKDRLFKAIENMDSDNNGIISQREFEMSR